MYNARVSIYRVPTEGRGENINFSGTGFVFIRHYESGADGIRSAPNEFVLDGDRFAFEDSTLIYTPPFHAHKFVVHGPLRNWIIGIDQSQACKLFINSPLAGPLEAIFESWKRLPPLMAVREPGEPDFEAFVKELISRSCGQGSLACLNALHLLIALGRGISGWKGAAEASGPRPLSGAEVARVAKEFLERNFSRNVGVKECARNIGDPALPFSISSGRLPGIAFRNT